MSKLTERANYLKGLAEGLKLSADKDANRVLLELLDLTEEMARELEDLRNDQDELSDYVEAVDDDLADLEEFIFDDEDDEYYEEDDDDEDDEDDDGAEDGEAPVTENEVILYACPHCGEELKFLASEIDFDEDLRCPACGKSVFPEAADEDDAEEEHDVENPGDD